MKAVRGLTPFYQLDKVFSSAFAKGESGKVRSYKLKKNAKTHGGFLLLFIFSQIQQ